MNEVECELLDQFPLPFCDGEGNELDNGYGFAFALSRFAGDADPHLARPRLNLAFLDEEGECLAAGSLSLEKLDELIPWLMTVRARLT